VRGGAGEAAREAGGGKRGAKEEEEGRWRGARRRQGAVEPPGSPPAAASGRLPAASGRCPMADTHILTEEAANQLQDQLQANLEASQALTAKHRKKRVLYNAVRSCIHNLY
jgi:hypothetical protein